MLVHYHRGEERARALAAELGGAPVAQADLTVEAEVDRLFDEARAALGRIDVCAAVARRLAARTTSRSGSCRSSAGRRRCGRT